MVFTLSHVTSGKNRLFVSFLCYVNDSMEPMFHILTPENLKKKKQDKK